MDKTHITQMAQTTDNKPPIDKGRKLGGNTNRWKSVYKTQATRSGETGNVKSAACGPSQRGRPIGQVRTALARFSFSGSGSETV